MIWEDELSDHQIRGWRAASAALAPKGCLYPRHRLRPVHIFFVTEGCARRLTSRTYIVVYMYIYIYIHSYIGI